MQISESLPKSTALSAKQVCFLVFFCVKVARFSIKRFSCLKKASGMEIGNRSLSIFLSCMFLLNILKSTAPFFSSC